MLKNGGKIMPQEKLAMSDQVTKDMGKNLQDGIGLHGSFLIEHIREGQVIDAIEVNNVITNVGKAEVAGLFTTDTLSGLTAFDYIAIGTGTTAADATDTQLETEITTGGGARRGGANVTGTRTNTTVTNDTAQYVTTFTFTATFAVTESGVLNADSTGVLLCHQTFAAINVASGDSLQITWKVAVA